MIFSDGTYLATPYNLWGGAITKNDTVLAACVARPHLFFVSPLAGDPAVLVARLLTSLDNAAWEVWRSDTLVGILVLDHITPNVDARMRFAFFDDELASKAALLASFVERCFTELGLHRITFEAPAYMTNLNSFVRRKLGFSTEGVRLQAYHDGARWRDVAVLGRLNAGGVDG